MSSTVRRRLALVVSAGGAMLVALDGTVLILTQPSAQRDLGASVAQMQWTSTGYLLAVAALLAQRVRDQRSLRAGDRRGRSRRSSSSTRAP
ncbi:hypothetical protein [Microtetraspora malaysiensis]|uniref:Major facilitator superfamily (MFS) profile domain-containing protein n=1 Tax=Microtetraspora malaysiensis TaxID=161358 RepID=A0ABW6T3A4_9ACTN